VNPVHLRYAQAVARHGSFGRAAVACGVSQPALSNGIAALERSLGGRLFDRTTRAVIPTPLGTRLLPLVDSALLSLDAVREQAKQALSRHANALRVGLSPLIDAGLVARAFDAARHTAPDRSLVLREANMAQLRDALATGDLDLILVPAVGKIAGCRRRRLYDEPVMVVPATPTPPGRRRPKPAARNPIELATLSGTPLVLVPDECGLTAFIRSLFASRRIELVAYPGEAHSYRILQDWARLGLGAAILPASKLVDPSEHARPLHDNDIPITIGYEAIWRTDTPDHPTITRYVNHIAAATKPA
jgi:DNA-binding transcriptional LysR family regulator